MSAQHIASDKSSSHFSHHHNQLQTQNRRGVKCRQPQTNVPGPFFNHIAPSAETYQGSSDDFFNEGGNRIDAEVLIINEIQAENLAENRKQLTDPKHRNRNKPRLRTSSQQSNSSIDLLSLTLSSDENQEDADSLLNDTLRSHPELLNPIVSTNEHESNHLSANLLLSRADIHKQNNHHHQQHRHFLLSTEDPAGNRELETSLRSNDAWSTKSVPAYNPNINRSNNSRVPRHPGGVMDPMAAEISRSRYALQNKKLLEELEQRTFELAALKRHLKEVGGKSAVQGEHLRTFDQRILSLESEVRIQDKKLRETESKLAAYQQQLAHSETQRAIAVEENDHLKQQLKNITEDKQSAEKQRSEAVKNLEEMTKNMGEFRNHTKNKLERLGDSESGLKGEIEDLKKQIETCQNSMKVKEDSVKELQLQIEDMKRLAESKDERIQDLNGRLESCKHENELLKESNTITSTALSDAKLELESLKRTNACSCSEIQNHEHLNREIESLRQILISKDSELNTIKRAISTTSLDNVGFYSERVNSDNIAEPDMHEYSVMEAEKVRLRKQIKELENSLKSKNSELEAVKSQLSLWSSQYDEAKNFINANDCLVMRLERDNQQKQNSLEKCRKEISVLKVKVEDAKNEIITVEGKLKRSQMEYHQLKLAYNEGVCKYDNVSKKLEQNLEEFREKEEEYQNHIDQLREELKELTGNFELLASTVDNKDRTIKELQSHFDVMMPNLESVKGELTSLNSAHNQLKEQSSRVQEEKRKQIKHLESALGVYKEEVEKLNLQLRHQKDTFDLESENYGIEIEDLRGKVNKYESQLTATKTELSAMDKHVKELEAEAICKDGKISELELHIAEMLKEKSEMLEKHSKDSSDFENRFEDLNKLYQSVNSELNETQEKLSSANESLELKIAKVAQLEDLCKDNDSKIKSFIEQLEMKSNILEKEIQNKKEAEELVCELQDEMKLKTAQNLKLADELNITRERYKEIDRTFSDYYQGSQDILAHNKALSEKVKELQSSMQNLKASLESTRDDLTQSNDQIGILQSLLSEKQIDCANKQQKILELEHRNQVGNMCKEDVENKVTELEQKLEKVKTSFQDSEQKVKVLEGQLVMKDDQISMREDKISLLTGKLDSIVKLDDSNLKKLEEVTRSASEKSEEVQKVKSENVKLREDIKTCEAEMSKMYRKNSELDEKLKKLDSETNALNASKKSLSEELNLKDSEVQTLKTLVEKYELRESKLKVAVTDEISRLKTVVEKLTEEHNKELKEQHDQFKESLSSKDFHMQKIAQDMQQSSMREQILRNDLAQAINQINYFKNNQAFYLSSSNMNNQGASSNGTLNSPDSPTSYTFEQNTDQVYQGHPDERYDAMQKQHHRKHQKHILDNGLSGVVYPAGTNVPKFSSITGKGVVASTNSGVSPRTVPSIDRMTEIRSDPMLLNFHYLPHDEQQQAMEMPSPSEGQTQRSVESQGLLKPHQTLQRTYSDSRALKSTGLMSNEETARQNVNARENLRPEKSSPNINADKVAPKSAPPKKLNDTSRGADSPFLEISADVADIFRKVKENMECEIPKTPNNDVQNQLESKKGRSYKVPLSNGDENAAGMKSKASKRMSVQEMSFTYNSEDELMNQSFHSLTSLNASQEGLDSVRSHTPAMLEMSHNSENGDHLRNELSAVSFDADGDRVANSTGTDEEFLRMLDANSRKRKELEQKLNLLVEKTGTVLNDQQ